MVKPSNMIYIISKKITKQNILAAIREGEEQTDDDPIQPIIDIIRSSLMKYDLETVRVGLKALGDAVECIFKNEALGKDEAEKISTNVFHHIASIGKFAASKGDDTSTMEVINSLNKCGIIAADRKFENVANQVAISLRGIREVASKQKLENAVSQATKALEKLQIASKGRSSA